MTVKNSIKTRDCQFFILRFIHNNISSYYPGAPFRGYWNFSNIDFFFFNYPIRFGRDLLLNPYFLNLNLNQVTYFKFIRLGGSQNDQILNVIINGHTVSRR